MANPDSRTTYRNLLEIRQKARRRDVRILGFVCLLVFLGTLAVGLVAGLSGRQVYLVLGLDVVFLLVFIMAWVRLTITGEIIELLEHSGG